MQLFYGVNNWGKCDGCCHIWRRYLWKFVYSFEASKL